MRSSERQGHWPRATVSGASRTQQARSPVKDDSARKSRGVKINGVGLGDVSEVDEERQTTVSEVKGSEQKYIRTVITRKQKNFQS